MYVIVWELVVSTEKVREFPPPTRSTAEDFARFQVQFGIQYQQLDAELEGV